METSLLYKLPKDILIKLLEKSYDFNEIPIEDIFDILVKLKERIIAEKRKIRSLNNKQFKIEDLTMWKTVNKEILIDGCFMYPISIDIYTRPTKAYVAALWCPNLYRIESFPELYKKLSEFFSQYYEKEIIQEILDTIKLIVDNIYLDEDIFNFSCKFKKDLI